MSWSSPLIGFWSACRSLCHIMHVVNMIWIATCTTCRSLRICNKLRLGKLSIKLQRGAANHSTVYLVHILALKSLYRINTVKCTRILLNHNFINILLNSNMFQPLDDHSLGSIMDTFQQSVSTKWGTSCEIQGSVYRVTCYPTAHNTLDFTSFCWPNGYRVFPGGGDVKAAGAWRWPTPPPI